MSNKKESPRPADPVILKGPNAGNGEIIDLEKAVVDRAVEKSAPQQLKLQAFPDGSIFKVSVHPKEPGTYAMFDVNKQPVGFFENPNIAQLCCDAVRMLFSAVEQSQRPKPGTPDNLVAECNTPEMPPVMES